MATKKKFLSFIIPIKDEEESLEKLVKEIEAVAKITAKKYEVIFVDDGSSDESIRVIKKIKRANRYIKCLKLRGNFGKSIALMAGFKYAKGDIIFTLDGDLQDNPKEVPKFLEKINKGFDLVSGWKKKRYDPITKTVPSKIGNSLTRILTGVNIHDLNCGFKAYKKEVVKNLKLSGELYKFIPIIASKERFKVTEVIVEHRKRVFGKSKFGWERNTKGVLDLITVIFLTSYLRRPGHFFGTLGIAFFIPGFLIGLYITYLRVTTGTIDFRYPLLFLGALLMIVGVQFISTGLLAEMINVKEDSNIDSYITQVI